MRPRLCKRFAASVRRRNNRSSLFLAGNLLHERFEARIAAKIVEEWICREQEQVALVASRKALQRRDRFAGVDIRFPFDSFRSDLESLGESQRDGETKDNNDNENFHDPGGCVEGRERDRGGLNKQPRHHRVCDGTL
jgi:hypothetical protein